MLLGTLAGIGLIIAALELRARNRSKHTECRQCGDTGNYHDQMGAVHTHCPSCFRASPEAQELASDRQLTRVAAGTWQH